jgi:hypothetical protein
MEVGKSLKGPPHLHTRHTEKHTVPTPSSADRRAVLTASQASNEWVVVFTYFFFFLSFFLARLYRHTVARQQKKIERERETR